MFERMSFSFNDSWFEGTQVHIFYDETEDKTYCFYNCNIDTIYDKKCDSDNREFILDGHDLVEELEITKKNIDAFTYILMLFETNPPEGEINKEKNEFKLIIKKYEGKKYMLTLKNTICEDDNFFRKNMEKKMKQLENNLETICSNLENANKELNNKNNLLENELNKIITANENLENNNKVLSKALQDLKKSQDKVLVHLDQFND